MEMKTSLELLEFNSSASRSRVLRTIATIVIVLVFDPSPAAAMPLDTLLNIDSQLNASAPESRRMTIESGYDFAPDEAAYVGHVQEVETTSPIAIARYQGSHLFGRVRLTNHLAFEGGIWDRAIANKRDRNTIESVQTALQYDIPGDWRGNRFAIRVGYWNNHADALTKSSFTRINGYTINALAVVNPHDEDTQINLISRRDLSRNFNVTSYIGMGSSQIGYDRVEGTFRDKDDCGFRFNLEKDRGRIQQLERCGSVITSEMYMPTEASIMNNIGINPRESLEYSSVYYQIGANARFHNKRWMTTLGYEYQQFTRDGVDEIIAESGKAIYASNHTVTLDLTYRLADSIDLFGRTEYLSNRLLSTVPFSYNGFTSERFAEEGIFFTVGLRVGF